MRRNPGSALMVLNPGRPKKRRASKKRKASKKRRAHHVANPAPKKRRRAKASRRGYRRNPSRSSAGAALQSPIALPKLGKLDMGFALVTGAGVVGHGMATNYLANVIPVPQVKAGAGKFGLGLGLAVAGSWAAFAFLPKKWAVPMSVGMGTSVVVQGLNTFVFPHVPALPMSGYESIDMLEGYQDIDAGGTVAGLEDDRFAGAWS